MPHPRSLLTHLRTRTVAFSVMAVALAVPAVVPAFAQDSAGPLTIYSGRSESLAGPILERFSEATGIAVQTKYADTAELAAILLEEGERSPADVFFAQDAGALGAVSDAGLFSALDDAVLEQVPDAFVDPQGQWVGVSGRARTVAYTTAEPVELPESIRGFTDAEWAGRIGWAPANGSFQSFVTALRVIEGEEVAKAWLEGILENEPVAYAANTAAVEGVANGEVDVAFVNHYYLLRLIAENGDDYPVNQMFFANGDLGSLVNVAGIGQLASSDQPEAAAALIEYLLTEEAQLYFAESTYEFPLIEGVPADPRLPSISEIDVPDVDLSELADLQGTVTLLREVGAID